MITTVDVNAHRWQHDGQGKFTHLDDEDYERDPALTSLFFSPPPPTSPPT